jgi:hypothetical protein
VGGEGPIDGRPRAASRRVERRQSHDDAGGAEAALGGAVRGEGRGPPRGVGQAVECRQPPPGGASDRRDTGDAGMTVDPHRAAAALALWAAPVLGAAHAEVVAQDVEE